MSTVHEKQLRILPFFKYRLTTPDPPPSPKQDSPGEDLRLKGLGRLPKDVIFSGFNIVHLNEARELYEILYKARDFEDFVLLAEQARRMVNEGLFVYALSVAIMHRDDLIGVKVPPYEETRPDLFIPSETIFQAIKEDRKRKDDETIIVNAFETGSNLESENRLAFFREDVGINVHHYHWHVVYPITWRPDVMGKIKDRKGELFYYMHQQMMARYDCERLGIGLQRVIPFQNFAEKFGGYAPHLTSFLEDPDQDEPQKTGNYGSRPIGLGLIDLNRADATGQVEDLERWKDRLMQAAHLGAVIDESGKIVPLTVKTGIDVLGAMIEASYLSINSTYYGDFHNKAHNMISLVHDPDGRFKQNPGVMVDTATAMRDPMFYRLHKYVDNMFTEYKNTLPSYEQAELEFPGIILGNVNVKAKTTNVLNTFMTDGYLELSHRIPLKGSVQVKYQHLDHESFDYEIECENKTTDPKKATVRIFLAPVYNELGQKIPVNEQRRFFMELDKFQVTLKSGQNTITRKSIESSVTSKATPSFEKLIKGDEEYQKDDSYCYCGWPEYFLVPRGNHRGMDFILFAMLTNYENDRVYGPEDESKCEGSPSYCGIKDRKYPDKRAMGYPFDRVIKARSIEEFLLPNMKLQNIKIQFME
ncbi:hemocyanin F chain [Nephila pilipes]|uniref:Hemocyanin F chain n=1 Tax=Nephila pilipes TaxID=299642 RepID=A0A8X6P951_NEPPI|nr:hemocyanin F chain [Nephila pilipes]